LKTSKGDFFLRKKFAFEAKRKQTGCGELFELIKTSRRNLKIVYGQGSERGIITCHKLHPEYFYASMQNMQNAKQWL
jgi:hypothetical protein